MRSSLRSPLSLGAALLLAACQPLSPEAEPAPRPRVRHMSLSEMPDLTRPFSHLDSAAFGALDGADALIVAASDSGAPRQVPPYPHGPIFPPDLFTARVSGHVVMAFEIDASGHFVPGTGAVVTATRAKFAKSVCAMLPSATYSPATRDGRPRRAIAIQTFDFNLDRPQKSPPTDPKGLEIMSMSPSEAVRALVALPGCP